MRATSNRWIVFAASVVSLCACSKPERPKWKEALENNTVVRLPPNVARQGAPPLEAGPGASSAPGPTRPTPPAVEASEFKVPPVPAGIDSKAVPAPSAPVVPKTTSKAAALGIPSAGDNPMVPAPADLSRPRADEPPVRSPGPVRSKKKGPGPGDALLNRMIDEAAGVTTPGVKPSVPPSKREPPAGPPPAKAKEKRTTNDNRSLDPLLPPPSVRRSKASMKQ